MLGPIMLLERSLPFWLRVRFVYFYLKVLARRLWGFRVTTSRPGEERMLV